MTVFTIDHAISYQTHERMGTAQVWVDDTVAACNRMMGRPLAPMAGVMGRAAARLTYNLVLTQPTSAVLDSDQMMHGPGEDKASEPRYGGATLRSAKCFRLKKLRKTIKRCGLDFDTREVCEVERMHLTHPNHPTTNMGIIPTQGMWEENGSVWMSKVQ